MSMCLNGSCCHCSIQGQKKDKGMFFLQIWRHCNAGTLMELLDPNLREQCTEEDALRVFHVGLLCAQASPNLRPPMWKVVEMLSGRDHKVPGRPSRRSSTSRGRRTPRATTAPGRRRSCPTPTSRPSR